TLQHRIHLRLHTRKFAIKANLFLQIFDIRLIVFHVVLTPFLLLAENLRVHTSSIADMTQGVGLLIVLIQQVSDRIQSLFISLVELSHDFIGLTLGHKELAGLWVKLSYGLSELFLSPT